MIDVIERDIFFYEPVQYASTAAATRILSLNSVEIYERFISVAPIKIMINKYIINLLPSTGFYEGSDDLLLRQISSVTEEQLNDIIKVIIVLHNKETLINNIDSKLFQLINEWLPNPNLIEFLELEKDFQLNDIPKAPLIDIKKFESLSSLIMARIMRVIPAFYRDRMLLKLGKEISITDVREEYDTSEFDFLRIALDKYFWISRSD